uniref:valine--tRNA ligase n=1 Tax=Astyanax mexicanus TaxID=7994 RepID=A0A8B9KGR3_ASTMX
MDSLYVSSHPDDFRSLQALIAAEFSPSRPQTLAEEPPARVARCRPALVLRDAEATALCGAGAVSWYLASVGGRTGSDAQQQSEVWQWLSFAENELTPVACAVVFPLLGVMGVDKKLQQSSRAELLRVLKVLDQILEPRTFLVGESLSLADVAVAMAALLPFKYALEPSDRKTLVNVSRWFDTCVNQPQLLKVLGKITLCEKMVPVTPKSNSAVNTTTAAAAANGTAPSSTPVSGEFQICTLRGGKSIGTPSNHRIYMLLSVPLPQVYKIKPLALESAFTHISKSIGCGKELTEHLCGAVIGRKGDRIYHQLKKLGSSLDWDRACFTMDPKLSYAVQEAFIRMHEEGVIYRSKRLVNWSCTLNSAISDIEVDKKELIGRTLLPVPGYKEKVEFGVLVSFSYKIEGSDEEIVVATTRIETMLGDTAVAVHPEDSRYQHLKGKTVIHPFCDRKLPIVFDDFVDMNFGTGAVKITPAHDHNDYEVGERHKLPFINILDENGFLINVPPPFLGMKRFDARKAVLQALKDRGQFKEVKDNPMVVPVCSRSKDIVEPLLKPQWYVDCADMGKQAADAVRNGELKIIPDHHLKTWFNWMDNIRDWCISRQLWWGHRIPAYFITVNDPSVKPGEDVDGHYWVSGRSEEEAREKAAKRFNVTADKISLRQGKTHTHTHTHTHSVTHTHTDKLIFLRQFLVKTTKVGRDTKLCGSESVSDRWILSRLCAAVTLCGNGFQAYDFPAITTAIYNFWLYELCDVYLESVKPVFSSTDAESQKQVEVCRQTLYTCLEVGLRLLSPIMPFVSEELFQRLPRRQTQNSPASISVTPYPESSEFCWHSEEIDREMEFVMTVVRTIRSLRADYNLTKTRADCYLQCIDSATVSLVEKYSLQIQTLSYSQAVHPVSGGDSAIPEGCAVAIASDKCSVHLMLKGLIDLEKEVAKLTTKQGELEKQMEKLEEKMKKSDYREKVPAKVQELDAEKLRQSQTELQKVKEAIENFRRMM